MITTRDRLLAATNELFRRRGYHGTSLKQVTDAAQAPIGSLYHFFPGGKVELTEAVIVETGARYLEVFELIADDSAGVAAAVENFFQGAAVTLEESDYIDVCPIGTVAREVAYTDERLRRAAGAVFSTWIAALARRLEDAGVEGGKAAALATTIIAGIEGAFVIARTARDGDVLRNAGGHFATLVRAAVAPQRVGRGSSRQALS